MQTRSLADARPEGHRQFIDVQFLIQCAEKIGVAANTGHNLVFSDQLAERDLLLYTYVDKESTLTMTPGSFVIFSPRMCTARAALLTSRRPSARW